jgi:hypothetical protein
MHDWLSVNVQIRSGLEHRVRQFIRTGRAGDLFDTNLWWADKFTPADEELAIHDKYHAVIAIAHREQLLLPYNLRHAREWIRMHVPRVESNNSYEAPHLFCKR